MSTLDYARAGPPSDQKEFLLAESQAWEPKKEALPLTDMVVSSWRCLAVNRTANVFTSLCEV